jgi:CRISPR-associated protein Cas2
MVEEKNRKTMYYILSYDIASPKRLPKMLKTCRRYLNWVQNSVFEGELTKSQFVELSNNIKRIIDKEHDSILLYEIRNKEVVDKSILGKEKNEITFMI